VLGTSSAVDTSVARLTDAVARHVVAVAVLAASTVLQTGKPVLSRRARYTYTSADKGREIKLNLRKKLQMHNVLATLNEGKGQNK